jgi:hypothetical protein
MVSDLILVVGVGVVYPCGSGTVYYFGSVADFSESSGFVTIIQTLLEKKLIKYQ